MLWMSKVLTISCLVLLLAMGVSSVAGKERVWHSEPGFRWADLEVPAPGKTGFTLMPPESTGITSTNVLDEWTSAVNRVLENGGGVAAGDFRGLATARA